MRLVQGDRHAVQVLCTTAELTGVQPVDEPVGDDLGQPLGRRVLAGERLLVVEVAVAERAHDLGEGRSRLADVDDEAVGVQVGARNVASTT